MKALSILASVVVAVGIPLAGSGCHRPTAAESAPAASTAAAAAVDRVTAGHPSRKSLQLYTSQPARIDAFEETPLFPKLAGYVESLEVDIGDAVTQGQILLTLWIPELQDELAQKEALYAQAEAEVAQAEAAVKSAEAAALTARARVKQAEAGIGRAEGDYQRWKSEHDRFSELAARGSVTNKLVDEALNQFRAAEAAREEAAANVQSATAGLDEAHANIAKVKADLTAAEAKRRVADANLKRTKTMVDYSRIKAPFDGIVTRRGVDTGHYVYPANGSAMKPLLVVSRTDRVRVFVDVPELEAPLVDTGDHADSAIVRVPSLRGREFQTSVTRTGWSLDVSNRSLRTEIDIPNEDGLLRPGMYATVTILLDQRSDALTLPITAVLREGTQTYCYCVESNRVERRDIELGLRSGDDVEIVSGLTDRDLVVLARADSLQPGQQVEVIQDTE